MNKDKRQHLKWSLNLAPSQDKDIFGGRGLRSLLFLVWVDGCQGSPTWCSGVTGRARPLLVLMLVGVVRIPIT